MLCLVVLSPSGASSVIESEFPLLSNDSVYARIGTVDSGQNRIGKSFKMAEGDDRREVNR